jgi:hypothetical protein
MVNVGPVEAVLVAMLAILGAAILVTIIVLVATTAMSATMLTMSPIMAEVSAIVRRRRWRDWHPSTDWMGSLDGIRARPPDPNRPLVGALAVLTNEDHGADLRLVGTQVATPALEGSGYSPSTMLHARLEPTTSVAMPPQPTSNLLVYVLGGAGTVGPARTPVAAGQLAVFGPDAKVELTAGDTLWSPALDVLIFDAHPSQPPLEQSEPMILRSDQITERLMSLKAQTAPADAPRPQTGRTDAPPPAPARQRARRRIRSRAAKALARH